jgi:hypothetical protein
MINRIGKTVTLAIISCGPLLAQKAFTERTAPFVIAIATNRETYKVGESVVVVVKKTNIGKANIDCSVSGPSGSWYEMVVTYAGSPAEVTSSLNEILHPPPADPLHSYSGSQMGGTCKSGEARSDEVPLSRYFNMTKPGQYTVYFSKKVYLHQQEYIVVQSNRIVINVRPADPLPE